MTKLIVRAALVAALAAGTAMAQPKPTPPAGSGSGSGHSGAMKAGTHESLEHGTGNRPWAAGVSQAEQRAALNLFQAGNVLLNNGLFGKAEAKYREALKHWNHPAIHYNLALAEMNLDQPIAAYDNLTGAIKYGDAPLQSKEQLDTAKRYRALLAKQIAEIEVTCDKPGAKVTVDGRLAFVAPGTYKAKVRVGKHTFVAEKEGFQTRINAPYIGPGEHFRIGLKLYTAEELTRYRRKWKRTWIPYAVAGGGVLLGVVGGVFEASAQSSYKSYDSRVARCSSGSTGCPDTSSLKALRNRGDTKRVLGFVGYGLAGAAVATGVVLWIINRPHPYQIRPEDLQDNKVSLAPIVAPDFAGASLQGHF